MQEAREHIRLTTGERIALWTHRAGLKQKELALRVGVSAKQMSRYISGQIYPPGDKLARIADELGVSTDYLLCRTENPKTRVEREGKVPELVWIEFRVSKNDDPYGVPLNQRGAAACRELLALADYRPRNSPGRRPTLVGVGRSRVMQWIQELEDSTGIRVHSHLFRHTIATELAHDPSIPIAVTARILNHADPRTTMRYVSDREGAMASALAGR